jgi:hypothetical protein
MLNKILKANYLRRGFMGFGYVRAFKLSFVLWKYS